MKITGRKLVFTYRPIAALGTSIGDLAIFSISSKHQSELVDSLGKTLESCSADEFIKGLLPYICYPVGALDKDQEKPDSTILSSSDIEKLSSEDVEKIAGLYIEKHPDLYREEVKGTRTDEKDGTVKQTLEYGSVKYPREDGESNVRYLHRLYVIYEKHLRVMTESLRFPLLGKAQFSSSLSKHISDTLSMGDSMRKAIDELRSLSPFTNAVHPTAGMYNRDVQVADRNFLQEVVVPPTLPNLMSELVEMTEKSGEARRAESAELGNRLDQLIEVTSTSATFLVEMNRTQTGIAGEIKASGQEAARFAQRNIYLSCVVVIISLLSLGGFWLDHSQKSETSMLVNQYADRITAELGKIDQSVSNASRSGQDELRVLLDEMKQERSVQNSRFERALSEQTKVIDQLAQQRIADQQTIEQLKAQLGQIEDRYKSPKK